MSDCHQIRIHPRRHVILLSIYGSFFTETTITRGSSDRGALYMGWSEHAILDLWTGEEGSRPRLPPTVLLGLYYFVNYAPKHFPITLLSHPCSHQGMSVLKFEFLKKIFSDTWKHPDKNLYFMSFEIVKCGFNILCCIC